MRGNWWRAVWWAELGIKPVSPVCRGNTSSVRCREQDCASLQFLCCGNTSLCSFWPEYFFFSQFSAPFWRCLWTGTTITKLSPLTGACCKISGRFLCLSLAITHSIIAVRYLGLDGMLSNSSSKEPALDKISKGLVNSSSSHTWKAFFRVVAVDRENLN